MWPRLIGGRHTIRETWTQTVTTVLRDGLFQRSV